MKTLELEETAVASFAASGGSVKKLPGMCSWHDGPQCQSKATHYHHAYGTVCGYHAKTIETKHQNPREKCKVLKYALIQKLLEAQNTEVRRGPIEEGTL